MRKIAANYIYPIFRDPIKNGYILLNDEGTVIEIGAIEKEGESTEFYNGILCPGFTNAHCHIELSHLKGMFQKGSGMAGFIRQINSLRSSVDEAGRKEALKRELTSLYASGVTNLGDISNCNESFEAKAASPLFSRTFLEVFGTEAKDVDNIISDVISLKREADLSGIHAAPTPHSCYTSSSELIQAVSSEGLKSGYLSYHNQESHEEDDLIRFGRGALAEEYLGRNLSIPKPCGESPLIYFLNILKKTGKDRFYEKILLVHNVFTDQQSIDMAKQLLANSYWVTCPLSNIFIHNALAPLNLLRKNGVKIALGTDSLSSNDILSIAEEIKCIHKHFPEIDLNEVLTWACLNGAEALGNEEISGSFEIGKKPGVVLIDNIDFNNMKLTNDSKSKRIL